MESRTASILIGAVIIVLGIFSVSMIVVARSFRMIVDELTITPGEIVSAENKINVRKKRRLLRIKTGSYP